MEQDKDYINESNSLYFSTKIHKNCRKFFKRIYDCNHDLSEDFVNSLSKYGKLTVNRFSQIVPNAKDVFSVKGKDGLEMNGVINDKTIFVVIPKNEPELYESFESQLTTYLSNE